MKTHIFDILSTEVIRNIWHLHLWHMCLGDFSSFLARHCGFFRLFAMHENCKNVLGAAIEAEFDPLAHWSRMVMNKWQDTEQYF